jgi:Na+/H+-translocating membrane pyrophosphatase
LATGLTIDVYGPVCDNAGGETTFRDAVPNRFLKLLI